MLLDFEKPIAELEAKLNDMKHLASDSDKEVKAAVKALEKKIQELKRETFDNLTGWQRVQLSRHPERPYTLDYIYEITSDFIELHGDRTVADDKAMIGGLGTIDGQTFMLIGQQKGRNTKQRQMRNFGMANPEGYRKALRLMQLAGKFNKPVVSFVDTPGADPNVPSEERGISEAIARNLRELAVLPTPTIAIVIGEGGSGGALGIAVADIVLMLEHSFYSVIAPEGCAAIIARDATKGSDAARWMKVTAHDALALGLIDGVIREPLGGAHRDPAATAESLREAISNALAQLTPLSTEALLVRRAQRLRGMGRFETIA